MRIFKIDGTQVTEHDALAPMAAPGACERGYLWLSLTREEFQASLPQVQEVLQSLCGTLLLDLHVSDLPVAQVSSNLDNLEPVEIAQGLRSAGDGIPDSLVNSVG